MSLRRASALALSTTAVVGGLLVLGAVLLAPPEAKVPLAWGGGAAAVLLTAAVTTAVHATLRARALAEDLARGQRDADRFIGDTLPRLVARLRAGDSAATALNAATRGLGELDNANSRALLDIVATEVGRGESARAAAMSACANAAGRMQALATGMLADLREMEHRHTDEDVLGDLLHLDHRTAQAGRLADSIAVLTGARSGRRWAKPIVMESVLRGAMGRINGYQRVRLHSTSEIAVAGHAAEGVMHALAELLDNAANFSPPTAEVHVYVEEVPAGAIITVEDSGLVMSDVQLRRAERAVCARTPLDLTSLSGTRLGLAVVGCLARKHNLTVSFRPSARGGTGALMLLPQELLVQGVAGPGPAAAAVQAPPAPAAVQAPPAPAAVQAPPAPAPVADAEVREEPTTLRVRRREHARAETTEPVRPAPPAEPASDTTGGLPQFGEGGLPKRKRGRTLAAAHPDGPQAPARPAPEAAARRSAANRFSTFRQAVQGRADAAEEAVDEASPPPHPFT